VVRVEGRSTVEDRRPRNSYHRVCYVFAARAASACHLRPANTKMGMIKFCRISQRWLVASNVCYFLVVNLFRILAFVAPLRNVLLWGPVRSVPPVPPQIQERPSQFVSTAELSMDWVCPWVGLSMGVRIHRCKWGQLTPREKRMKS